MTSQFAPTEDEMAFAMSSMPIQEASKPKTISQSRWAPTDDEMEFASASMAEPINQEIPWYKSYPAALKKGLLQGLNLAGEQGKAFINEDPFGESGKVFGQVLGVDITPKEFQEQKKKVEADKLSEAEKSKMKEELEQRYPSEKGFVEGVIERAGKLAPSAALAPGGLVQAGVRTGAAAILGETAKEMGFGELGQALTETAAYVAPNPTRMLQAGNANQRTLLDFGRRMGLSEEQLTPIIKDESMWTRFLTGAAARRGRTQRALTESQRGLGQIYDTLRNSPAAQVNLTPQQTRNFVGRLGQEFHNLPANIRNEVIQDLQDLAQGPLNGDRLLNFYQDVSDTIQRIGGPRGRRLGGIQDSVMGAISSSSPQLGMDLHLTNQLYANYARMRTALQPSIVSDLLSGAKVIAGITSLITGNYPHLGALAGLATGRKLAAELVINPRLQNLQHKMLRALNENRISVANELLGQFREEIKDEVPEFYKELEDEEFTLKNQKTKKQ